MEQAVGLQKLIREITRFIAGRALDERLQDDLNARFPPESEHVQAIRQACLDGMEAGWVCAHRHGGIAYGRVLEAGPELHGFSVDVVDMNDIAGPHHSHPQGEIDLILPLDPDARFDGRGSGWLVYGPESAHSPTVSGGRALILYLLPQGEIQFTRRAKA